MIGGVGPGRLVRDLVVVSDDVSDGSVLGGVGVGVGVFVVVGVSDCMVGVVVTSLTSLPIGWTLSNFSGGLPLR